jgi:FkbM family methyltransferase
MSNLSLKQYIKHFPKSQLILRFLNKILYRNHGVWKGPKYFKELFSIRKRNNAKSLNFSNGVVLGNYHNSRYLISMRPSNFIESHIYIHGIWEPKIAELVRTVLTTIDPNQIMIDVGANIGASSIPIAKNFPNVEFHLFEPHPEIFLDLQKNCTLNGLKNVKLFNTAVSDQGSQPKAFYAQTSDTNMGLSSLKKNNDIADFNLIQVSTATLDCLFVKDPVVKGDQRVALIKIDTQGTEFDVLKSASRLIQRDRPVIIFEFSSAYQNSNNDELTIQREIEKFFDELGYGLYCIEDNSNYLPRIKFNGYFNGDILALPENSLIHKINN